MAIRKVQPRLLFCAAPNISGATWQIRALDLVQCRTAWRAVHNPTTQEIDSADAIVVVKQINRAFLDTVRSRGKPIIWDVADLHSNIRHDTHLFQLIRRRQIDHFLNIILNHFTFDIAVVANSVMQYDFENAGAPSTVLPHHFWPGLHARTTVNGVFEDVVYDGWRAYLDHDFMAILNMASKRVGLRSLRFCYNDQISEFGDAAIADRARGDVRWLDLRWKPGTKGINALAAGMPLVAPPESSLLELRQEGNMGILPFWDVDSMTDAFLTCRYKGFRRDVMQRAAAVRRQYNVEQTCRAYETLVKSWL